MGRLRVEIPNSWKGIGKEYIFQARQRILCLPHRTRQFSDTVACVLSLGIQPGPMPMTATTRHTWQAGNPDCPIAGAGAGVSPASPPTAADHPGNDTSTSSRDRGTTSGRRWTTHSRLCPFILARNGQRKCKNHDAAAFPNEYRRIMISASHHSLTGPLRKTIAGRPARHPDDQDPRHTHPLSRQSRLVGRAQPRVGLCGSEGRGGQLSRAAGKPPLFWDW